MIHILTDEVFGSLNDTAATENIVNCYQENSTWIDETNNPILSHTP